MAVGRTNVRSGGDVKTVTGITGNDITVDLGFRPKSVKIQYNNDTYDAMVCIDTDCSPYAFYTAWLRTGSIASTQRSSFIIITDTGFIIHKTIVSTGQVYRYITGR